MAGVMRLLVVMGALLAASAPAHAEVVTGVLGWIGTSLGASAASAVTVGAFVVSTAISMVSSAYASSQQKKKAREAAARQFQQDVANLRDRTITLVQTDAPPATIYGSPAPVAGALAMSLPHGLATEYKSLIIIFAGHESQEIEDVLIEGEALGIPPGGGWCTNPNFHLKPEYAGDMSAGPAVKVSYHLSPGGVDTADADLIAAMNNPQGGFPEMQLYTAAHKLSGYTYIVMTINLFFERFQGGMPNVTAKIKGKKVYDPRTGLTVYSRNPALCLVDFLRSEMGFSAAIEQIDMNAWIAAANACDEEVYTAIDAPNYGSSRARYVCDGMFRADQDRDATRVQLEEAMAGFALESAGVWRIQAGTWSTPVMALTDDDMLAPTSVVQSVNPTHQRYNGARGSYVNAAGNGVSEDFKPYSNATFLGLDGRPKIMDLALPFTASHMRCHQIARVRVERSRGGFTIRIHPKMKAWRLQPGDRLAVSSALFEFTNKTFIVRDWAFSRSAPLTLLCEEDVPATYDLADEVLADATPNSDLPNPFIAPPAPSGLTAESGPEQALNQDGVLVPRVLVSWEAATDVRVTGSGGAVRVQWRRLASADPWQTQDLPGDSSSTYLQGVVARQTYQIRVRFQTAWASSSFGAINHTVLDNFSAPGAVGGLVLSIESDGVHARWDLPSDLPAVYWAATEISIGEDYEDAALVWAGRAQQARLGWQQAGVRTVWAVHVDVVGRRSPPIAATISILPPAQPIVTAVVWRNEVDLRWADCRTSQPLRGYEVALGPDLADAPVVTVVDALSYAHTPSAAGVHRFWVVAVDLGGNRSAPGYVDVVTFPGIDEVLAELTDDLTSLGELVPRVDAVENKAEALEGEIEELAAAGGDLAASVERLQAEAADDDERLAAALIESALAHVNGDKAIVRRVETLEASDGDVRALLQTEQEARISEDEALAQQIVTAQAALGDSIATVEESIEAVASDVDGVKAQWTMKATAVREDGTPVFAGIGLAATASDVVEKSEIILMADRLLFVPPTNIDALPKPIFTAGLVDGVPTFVVPSYALGDRTYPGRILVDGSIEGRSVAADQIEGDHIKGDTIEARHLKADSVTATHIDVDELVAISAKMGNLHSGSVRGGAYTGYGWPTGSGTGYYLGPEGMLLGNANTGRYFQIEAGGNVYAPGMSIVNGVLSISQINVINTNNIVMGAVTVGQQAAGNNDISLYVNVPAGQTWVVLAFATYRPSNIVSFPIGGSNPGPTTRTCNLSFAVSAQESTSVKWNNVAYDFWQFQDTVQSQAQASLGGGNHQIRAWAPQSHALGMNIPIELIVLAFKR